MRTARLLFHLARAGIVAPRLLAFGQKVTSPMAADSFVLYHPPAGAVPSAQALAQWTAGLRERRALVRRAGAILRRLHDVGCGFAPGDGRLLCIRQGTNPDVVVGSPFALRLTKRLSGASREADLRNILRHELTGLGRADRARLVRGYLGTDSTRKDRTTLLTTLRTA